MSLRRVSVALLAVSLLIALAAPGLRSSAAAQSGEPAHVEVEPADIVVDPGVPLQLKATVTDAEGKVLDVPVMFFSTDRRNLSVSIEGLLEARRHGEYAIVAIVPNAEQTAALLQRRVAVHVTAPPIASVSVSMPGPLYVGSTYEPTATVTDTAGNARDDVAIDWRLDPGSAAGATLAAGTLTFTAPGRAVLRASAEGIEGSAAVEVLPNPVVALDVSASATSVRTGDVVHVMATPRASSGEAAAAVPIAYSLSGRTDDDILAPGASAQVEPDGRFVAEQPGRYVVTAIAGGHVGTVTVEVTPRDVRQAVELVGRGEVLDRHTSDLWVWTGPDGRDYAVTGTWGSDGKAIFWDVTDPSKIERINEVQVDARTVNDVKVSEDGRVAVISREGASNRRNGLVILDVSNPRGEIPVLSRFDDELTGGVHNVFIYDRHVYALSAGQRYDIIDIEDPSNPQRVGRFELDTPGHAIHDVWVSDGIAYSSNWTDGVVAVDVGGGGKGGTPRNPVKLGSYAYPSGWNHAAFPYRSKSTGKFYVFAGDEAFPYGLHTAQGSEPTRAAGWIHVIEWDQWNEPREVARYEVPEAGTHNLWIEDDVLYVAYYNGGLRVVDVSGELMGDLYRQGREIGRFIPDDPKGYSPNAPMVWGPQPHKGTIFFSDWNTGLWAVRLAGEEEEE